MKMSDKGPKDVLDEIEKQFHKITKTPTEFLRAQDEKCGDIQQLLQQIYQVAVQNDDVSRNAPEVLQELQIEDMDEEQIWQQLDLRNNVVFPNWIEQTSKLIAIPEKNFEVKLDEDDAEDEDEDEGDNEDDNEDFENNEHSGSERSVNDEGDQEDDEAVDREESYHNEEPRKEKKKFRSTIVDDEFFKLGEMEAFLEAEEAKEMRKQNGMPAEKDASVFDFFGEDLEDDDDEDGNPNYKDFFDNDDEETPTRKQKDHFASDKSDTEEDEDEDLFKKPKELKKKNQKPHQTEDESYSNEENEDDEDDEPNLDNRNNLKFSENTNDSDSDADHEDDKPKSSYEQRQERLQQRIRDYENEVLGEKPWQLKGEIKAASRPQNSLLEEIIEFESATRPAPVITEETTRCLEDIIRQRIKDQAWDDVEQQVRTVPTALEYRKKLILDQEKSKESLAQIYEKEYQNELSKLDPNRDDNEPKEEPKAHKAIRKQMNELFLQLDTLFSLSFTPRAAPPEAKIITNTPAIAMEEVAPVATSDANLLAPKEVFRGAKHELLGKSERSRTDKNRERRKKKQKQRAVHKAIDAKATERQKLGIPLSKKHEDAKLLKSVTKHRNVDKTTASNDKGALKSSKAFFSKLQDTATTVNSSKKVPKRKADAKSLSAKKLKL